MATTKSLDVLKGEVGMALTRLGGQPLRFQRGRFEINGQSREGYRVYYGLETGREGEIAQGRLEVAALPVKREPRRRRSSETRQDKSLRMALFMLREALDGAWFLQQLSPGYAPLMPWMLVDGERTVTELWSQSGPMQRLLPDGGEFIEGEICPSLS